MAKAKKVRRTKKKKTKNSRSNATVQAAPEAVAAAVEPTVVNNSTRDEFRIEYAYVVKDLRRVLILAAALFLLLITLNLLLQ